MVNSPKKKHQKYGGIKALGCFSVEVSKLYHYSNDIILYLYQSPMSKTFFYPGAPPIFGAGFATAFLPATSTNVDTTGWPAEPPRPGCHLGHLAHRFLIEKHMRRFSESQWFWDVLGYHPKIGQPPNLHGNLQGWFRAGRFPDQLPDGIDRDTVEATFTACGRAHSAGCSKDRDLKCPLGCTTRFICHSAFMSCQKFGWTKVQISLMADNPNISKQAHRYLVIVGSPAL